MLIFIKRGLNTLFGSHLEFRNRLFNVLACTGLATSLISGLVGLITNAGPGNLLINIFLTIMAAFLIWYVLKSGNYQLCYMITIGVVFFIMFPLFFVSAGGYKSGMPVFFIFAVVFTVLMLEGAKMIIFTVAQLILYTSLLIYAYFYPEQINNFDTEIDMLIDIIFSFIIVGFALGITLSLHLRSYMIQQKELEAARRQAEEFAKMNSGLFAEMSHEMRTPLAVMSAYAQFAVEQIKETGANEQTLDDLAMISDEAKRLARMADGTLKVLMSVSGRFEVDGREVIMVDMGNLAERLGHLLQPVAMRRGKELSIHIGDDIQGIRGDSGELTQLLWNVLQNAMTHAQTSIKLSVSDENEGVTIKVEDDGKGISREVLPHVMEWGIIGDKGGTGVGLSICRDIVQRHRGSIAIQTEEGKGTCVAMFLKGKSEVEHP